jgi:cephalosporin-C deacetylase
MIELPHNYGFDPRHGYSLEQLLEIKPPSEPADFADFWEGTYHATRSLPLDLERAAHQTLNHDFRVTLVRFNSLGGVRLGAWLIEPTNGPIDSYVVTGHGYYNRPFEDVRYVAGTANLFFGSRGLGISRVEGIPDQTMSHVLHGIEARETYVHRGCVADVWAAASAMLDLHPQAAGRLHYSGESFGGGVGTMAMAWDHRFATAEIRVPSFGHHPIRLKCRCSGAGEAVRRRVRNHPDIYERTLRYFDAAVHARHLRIPTAFSCALFDPAVPPPGQFAVYNAARCEKVLTVWQAGHHHWDGTNDDIASADRATAEMLQRFREKLNLTHSPRLD